LLAARGELGRDARLAEAHRATIGDLRRHLPQRRELGRDARLAEAHRAAIGGLGLGLPQRREAGYRRSRGQSLSRIHLVSPRLARAKLPSLNEGEIPAGRKKRNVKNEMADREKNVNSRFATSRFSFGMSLAGRIRPERWIWPPFKH
jgi:hypothetical protein